MFLVLLSWLRGIGYPGEFAPGEMMGLWASWRELLLLYALLAAGLVVSFRYQPEVHPWRFLGHWGLTGLVGFAVWTGLALGAGFVGSLVMNRLLPGSEFYAVLLSGVFMEGVFAVGSLSLVYLQLQGRLQFWVFGDYPVFSSLFRGAVDFLRVFPWVMAAAVINKYVFVWMDFPQDLPHSVVFFTRAEGMLQHAGILLLVLAVAPICEELLFRGVLYRLFRSWTPARVAAAASGGVFGLLHFDGLVVLPLLVFGYHLGRTYEQTGSLVVTTSMHASQNAVSLVLMYLVL